MMTKKMVTIIVVPAVVIMAIALFQLFPRNNRDVMEQRIIEYIIKEQELSRKNNSARNLE